ncbi:Uncharacterised protein [Pseudomonas putida]|uniref:Uncharacterized protein n=1 Tax=Pseudomonas putida TaxID=303 RepID=A0A379KGS7_PSEPU|nr:Uncharacterised protein [Pseudomonas putida]
MGLRLGGPDTISFMAFSLLARALMDDIEIAKNRQR